MISIFFKKAIKNGFLFFSFFVPSLSGLLRLQVKTKLFLLFCGVDLLSGKNWPSFCYKCCNRQQADGNKLFEFPMSYWWCKSHSSVCRVRGHTEVERLQVRHCCAGFGHHHAFQVDSLFLAHLLSLVGWARLNLTVS